MFESLASCFAFRCSASLNMTAPFMRCTRTLVLADVSAFFQGMTASQPSTFESTAAQPVAPCKAARIDRLRPRVSSFIALNTGSVTAFARTPTDQIRADAERLSHIILEMQRCFVLHLCKELAPGNVSFPQFFLLTYLDRKEVLNMSEIAKKMGHTTA